jgi:hypothetical protein
MHEAKRSPLACIMVAKSDVPGGVEKGEPELFAEAVPLFGTVIERSLAEQGPDLAIEPSLLVSRSPNWFYVPVYRRTLLGILQHNKRAVLPRQGLP